MSQGEYINSLAKRLLSALVVLTGFFFVYFYFQKEGLYFTSVLVLVIGIYEYAQLTLYDQSLKRVKIIFFISCLILLPITAFDIISQNLRSLLTIMVFSWMILAQIWLTRGKIQIEMLLRHLALSLLGVLYCVVFATFGLRVMYLSSEAYVGELIFLGFLINVFLTDTSAYFAGIKFGKNKLMPELSPKKTIEGAIGGLFGSIIFTSLYFHFIPQLQLNWVLVMVLAFFTSIASQTGDLFESLLKRVANVKDSGKIMPGHGGVLDRLDGVYFAAPTFYTLYHILFM